MSLGTESRKIQLSDRAKSLKPSPTLAMANRARELQSQGVDVVSLAVGEPDWPSFPEAVQAAHAALDAGFTRYTAAHGIIELREAVAQQTTKELGVKYGAAEVAVATGAKYAIFASLQVILNPGDVVLIPAPYWVSYPTMVELAGGVSKEIPSSAETNFKIRPEQLEQAIQQSGGKARLLMLCSPNNPTGIAYTEAELAGLADVLRKHKDVMVMSDDIYNRLIFSGRSSLVIRPGQISLAAHILHVAPDLQDRVIIINGVSKTCSMTGWRVGWAVGPKSFIQPLADFLSQSTSNVCSIAQKAAVAAIEATDRRIIEVQRMLEQRRDLFSSGLSSVKGLKVHEPDGAFYLWVGIKDWFGKQHPRFAKPLSDSKVISEALLENAGLAVVPGLEFGIDGYLRLSLASSEKNLAQASDRMRSFANELK